MAEYRIYPCQPLVDTKVGILCQPLVVCCRVLLSSERQVRDLVGLEIEQREVWQQAVYEAERKIPSGKTVSGIVEQLKTKPLTDSLISAP